jgi:hypothetical protein
MNKLIDFICDGLRISKFSKVRKTFRENKVALPLTRPVFNKDPDKFLQLYEQYIIAHRRAADCFLPENKTMLSEEVCSRISPWLQISSDIKRYHMVKVEGPLKVVWFNDLSL